MIWEKITQTTQDWFGRLDAAGKQRLVLSCTIIFAAILTLSVLLSLRGRNADNQNSSAEIFGVTIISPIPAGEIFLPDEPDFLPGVLLERERRSNWTIEDASEFWQDPLRFGEEQWREKIEEIIDLFLERVP